MKLTRTTCSLTLKWYAIIFLLASIHAEVIAQAVASPRAQPNATQNTVFPGSQKPLVRGSLMPYVAAKVGGAEGLLQLDFGSTFSSIDNKKFSGGAIPKPVSGTTNSFEFDEFFGPENKQVTLSAQSYTIQLPTPLVQAGIIGTDVLCERIFTLDYTNNKVYSSPQADFYSEQSLRAKGFKPVSTAGYYTKKTSDLNNNCTAKVPTVPIKIGAATAVAQIDPGYDDKIYRYAININKAFYNSLKAAGVSLTRAPERDTKLTTCAGTTGNPVWETVTGYKLSPGQSFEITGTDGKPVFITSEVSIFLKDTPPEAKKCGGIAGWQIPAAQLGASFLLDAQQVIFDPFTSLVWFKAN